MIPRSRSAFSLSKTQAYLKEPFPSQQLLLKLFDGSLVDSTTFVDQVAGCGGLAGIYVSDYDDVDVSLFLSHFCFELAVVFTTPAF